jgi:hypothetical protein
MPSDKPVVDKPVRRVLHKLPAVALATPAKRKPAPLDAITQARLSRTRDVMKAARLREAELEKQGYCF